MAAISHKATYSHMHPPFPSLALWSWGAARIPPFPSGSFLLICLFLYPIMSYHDTLGAHTSLLVSEHLIIDVAEDRHTSIVLQAAVLTPVSVDGPWRTRICNSCTTTASLLAIYSMACPLCLSLSAVLTHRQPLPPPSTLQPWSLTIF